jgi:hypothetical protein
MKEVGRLLGRPGRREKDNIRMDLKDVVERIYLAQYRK